MCTAHESIVAVCRKLVSEHFIRGGVMTFCKSLPRNTQASWKRTLTEDNQQIGWPTLFVERPWSPVRLESIALALATPRTLHLKLHLTAL